ncbi:DEAD/DEAH box helicase [Enhygromyxa salina]|uniref:UvrABC system protein B n=1 Tax=Enhygromyxa salina TaxID=215803 RepID=A0A2S9XN72_9BACT|nr:DEAD/DEAH box helicase [Enhygromyxa salina]PRP94303.1 UvrABC system protein B [Enhygromyxa salina]
MRLRPYQLETVEAVITARRRGVRRMLVSLPTGSGKTVIFSELIRRAKRDVLVLAHRDELLAQAKHKIEAALRRAGDDRRVQIERGEARASASARVLVASIRSLHEGRIGRVLAGRELGLVIYDECHHAVADANRAVLERIGAFEPDWRGTLVGFTATTRRADGRALGEVFEQIVAERTLQQMIAEGYLRPLRGLRIETKVSLEGVTAVGEDFDADALEEAVDIQGRNQLVARSIIELCRDRRTIAFCAGVRHAENLCAALNRMGVRAAIVHGEMPKLARERTLAGFRDGQFRVITNVGVLTEGFDDPGVSAIAMVRPLRSESLYLQCVGRGMRIDPSASDCLVLDFVDLSSLEIITTATLEAGKQVDPPEREAAGERPAYLPVPDDDRGEAPATLEEITRRLREFDPLTMVQSDEAAAISINAWLSLGARGMMLHYLDHQGELRHFEVRPAARSGVEIWRDDRRITRCSSMSAAIEAVDYELPKHGDPRSARASAAWRRHPITAPLQRAVAELRPPRRAETVGDAIAHLALELGLRPTAKRAAKPTAG